MAIQHRRGADVDFKAEKMLPGEIAVTIDGTRKVYAAFAPGDVKELASKEEVQKIVDNFENSVGEKINEAVQQVTDEATEQVEGIVAKGEEILNSIPVDYQETVKEVAQLKEDLAKTTQSKADAIICEAEGTTIVATDSSDAGFEGLSLYGKSKQGSTTGAQLYDSSYRNGNGDIACYNGIVTEKDGVYTVTVSSKDTYIWNVANPGDSHAYDKGPLIELPDGVTSVYINISNESFKRNFITVYDANKVALTFGESSTNAFVSDVGNISGAKYISLRFGLGESITSGTYETTIMINAGTEPLPWEPYTNCKPSPNPEYTQEVVSAGDSGSIEGRVCGKNLLKNTATSKTENGVTFTVNDDGSVIANGTATAVTDFYIRFSSLWEYDSGQYILNGSSVTSQTGIYLLINSDGAHYSDIGKGTSEVPITNGKSYYVFIRLEKGATVSNLVFKPMIRLASIEDDTYEPYTEQTLTIQTPNGLPGIPVSDASLATYTDENGQMWCADEIDVERGVYVQRVAGRVINFTNVNAISSTSDGLKWSYGAYAIDSSLQYKMNGAHTSIMCDKFTLVAQQYEGDESTGTCASAYGHANNLEFRFRLLQSEYPTKEDAMNAINGTTVYYPLATPIETPLSDEEITAYKALHTNKPTTTIMNSENVYMKAKYVADTKNHIKQNYVPLSEYTALEERVAAIEELVIS